MESLCKYNKMNKYVWIALGAITAVYFATMYYQDNITIMQSELDTLAAVSSKGPIAFITDIGQPYGYFIQWIWCLWVLPVYFLNIHCGIDISGVGAYIWYKAFMLICMLICAYIIYRIIFTITENEKKGLMAVFLFCSSLVTVLCVVVVAQAEICYLVFVMLGVYFYIQNNEKGFILCFLISIPLKFLPVFVFIPLVLYHSKSFRKIFAELMVGCSGIVLDKIMGLFRVNTGAVNEFRDHYFQDVIGHIDDSSMLNLNGLVSRSSLFTIVFLIFCVWCFCRNQDEDRTQNKYNICAVWISFTSFLMVSILLNITIYWIVITIPFLVLIIALDDKNIRVNFVLTVLFELGMVYMHNGECSWVFGGNKVFDYLLLSKSSTFAKMKVNEKCLDVTSYLTSIGLYSSTLVRIVCGITVGAAVVLIYVNYPFHKNIIKTDPEGIDFVVMMRRMSIMRLLILVLWFMLAFAAVYTIL